MENMFEFTHWILEQQKDRGFHILGENSFRYNYHSPFTLEELYEIFSRKKDLKTEEK